MGSLDIAFPPALREMQAGRELSVESWNHFESGPDRAGAMASLDRRICPRYSLEVGVCVYVYEQAVVRGHTVDISESGISAILLIEIPLDKVVRLEFKLPLGVVEVLAIVRQRSAFRYGFQFIEDGEAQTIIRHSCRDLAVNQSLDAGRRE
jgi:hypothetical protein